MKKLVYIFIIITIVMFSSCSPQRKLHRLVSKHPELIAMDTILISDTTIIPEIRVDTMFHESKLKDTVTIVKEKLKLELVEVNDTIYVDAYHEPDTVILTKEIPVEKVIYMEPENWFKKLWKFSKNNFLVFIVILILLVRIILRSLRSKN